MKARIAYLVATLLLAAGCSSMPMDKADCLKADWYELGRQDAIHGNGLGYFARYEKECGAAGVPVDKVALEKGHAVGLPLFCSTNGGLRFGSEGGQYGGICSAEQEKDFLPAYQLGRKDFEIREKKRREDAIALRDRVLNYRGIAQSFECRTNEDCRLRGLGKICVAEQVCDGRCRSVGVCK